jgi:hypothetical protein
LVLIHSVSCSTRSLRPGPVPIFVEVVLGLVSPEAPPPFVRVSLSRVVVLRRSRFLPNHATVSRFSAPVPHLLRSQFVALGFAFLGFLPERAAVGLSFLSRRRAAAPFSSSPEATAPPCFIFVGSVSVPHPSHRVPFFSSLVPGFSAAARRALDSPPY